MKHFYKAFIIQSFNTKTIFKSELSMKHILLCNCVKEYLNIIGLIKIFVMIIKAEIKQTSSCYICNVYYV